MEVIDGKKIAQKLIEELREEVKKLQKPLRLAIVRVGKDAVTSSYLERKKKTGEEIGISVRVFEYPSDITTDNLRKQLAIIVHEKKNTGVIVQLPLPEHIGAQYILNSITPEKDVDMLSSRALGNLITGKSPILSPVAGAVRCMLEEYKIEYQDKKIAIVGAGCLVGRQIALWLMSEDIGFNILTKNSKNISEELREADIVISGTGQSGFITGDMVKDGVIAIDCGTSTAKGSTSTSPGRPAALVGDFDFNSVSQKASLITPVPGGVGPLAVVMLFKNLIELSKNK